MTTTVFRVNIKDINLQFFKELEEKMGASGQVEIKVEGSRHGEGLFSEEQFWRLIDQFDWKQKKRADIVNSAINALSAMPVSAIYLFEDFLSEKLFNLDTRQHAEAYMKQQEDDYFSVDDFLYVRCAVVAEGRAYYEEVEKNPSALDAKIDFEQILYIAAEAYNKKTGREFEYSPLYNYETKSNLGKWK
ncbi:DUF4240 domain-containing protein [Haliscomenobacter hydrossis]|uniref:DUF4240 domain-containing protein n=1 Tax=Haliscomenobacter hydrossis (strain ATCC 27775 / DSM 1100 / LMG 10767 / O) TaxID=760192 RepID=F4KQE9_HALH1|nr:DUF4240 domain-containing protein [Haliscomenobacter hydrossis]AEE48975.1 hypothetical protein Halhy_1076 [Haliscomenobacter hydrossis DSM 1100]